MNLRTLNDVRRGVYNAHSSEVYSSDSGWETDPNDWRKNPYTFIKSRYFIELGSFLIFIILKLRLNLNANALTLLYAFSGPVAALLLLFENSYLIFLSLFIFFSRSCLDWVDGFWARYRKEASLKGHILDAYGAKMGTISLYFGVGLFKYNQTSSPSFLIILAFIMFINSLLIRDHTNSLIIRDLRSGDLILKTLDKQKPNFNNYKSSKKYLSFIPNFILAFFYGLFDGRARIVDTVLFFILVDYIFNFYLIDFFIYLILLKTLLHFTADFFIFYKSSWLKDLVNSKN